MPSERSNSSGSYRSVTHLSADLALVLKVSLVMIAIADAGAESAMTSTSSTLMVAVNFFIAWILPQNLAAVLVPVYIH